MEGFRYQDLMRWKLGQHLAEPYYGIYFPGVGKYDIDGDGDIDYNIYTEGKADSSIPRNLKLNTDIFLSEGDKGMMMPVHNILFEFDPVRDYLYPVPINERTLNPNLTQNPGWDDGLAF